MKINFGKKSTEVIFHDKLPDLSNYKVVIVDEHIFQIFGKQLNLAEDKCYIVKAGETSKSLAGAEKIFSFFHKKNVKRTDKILGLGGGITTDLAAFAISSFKRGCRLELMPTSFLAMIDASIGGKTALNFENLKNIIGSFYPAETVHICPEFLDKLPDTELMNGWAECIKIYLVFGLDLSALEFKNLIPDSELIRRAISLKARLCEEDLEDRGNRRLLNLGHSFGHVIESISNYKIAHGQAVAFGIIAAAKLSLKKEFINEEFYREISNLIKSYKFAKPEISILDLEAKAEELLWQDKKASDKLNLILLKASGAVLYSDLTAEEIINVMKELLEIL